MNGHRKFLKGNQDEDAKRPLDAVSIQRARISVNAAPMLIVGTLLVVLVLAAASASIAPSMDAEPTALDPSPAPILSSAPAMEEESILLFEDVPEDHWAFESINRLTEAGWLLGCSTDPRLFCPDELLSRAQAGVFLARGLYGSQYDPPEIQESMFIDIDPQAWYARWIAPLYQQGYLTGCQEEPLAFCPDETLTTAQGIVLFMRMLYGPSFNPTETEGIFTDVPIGSWHAAWLESAYYAGILTPCSAKPRLQACPETPLSRAMAAVMLARLQSHSEFSPP